MDAVLNKPESQLYLFEFLSSFSDMKNVRKRIKPSFFKTLNAIYLITRMNEEKGREFHYPGKELISEFAKVDRSKVTEFITSPEIEIFCDVKRSAFCSNHYFLKEWVYQWFRLFYRSGMMKGMQENYDQWMKDFQKRLKKWLVPLVQAGKTIRDIYESVVNKLSTKKFLKVAATNPLKGAAIKSNEVLIKPMGSEDIEVATPFPIPAIFEYSSAAQELVNRFSLREADANTIMKSFTLLDIKGGLMIRRIWDRNGIKPVSPVKTMIGAIKQAIKNKFCKKGYAA